MKLADVEWSLLRRALIALGISLAISAALVGTSYHFWESEANSLKTLQVQLKKVRDEFRTLDEEREMIATFFPRFQELESLGIIGREHRLNWIESLSEASRDLKLPDLSYAIKSRESFSPDYPLKPGLYQLYASEMSLEAGLLHGEDLIGLLRELDKRTKGLYSVSSCRLERRRDDLGNPDDVHVHSSCRLHWYTIKKPGEEGATT